MMAAYQELGYTTYHGFQYMAIGGGPAQIEWERAIDAKWYGKGKPFTKEDFDELLGEYEVLSDFPVVGFSEELLEMYPEVRQISGRLPVDEPNGFSKPHGPLTNR